MDASGFLNQRKTPKPSAKAKRRLPISPEDERDYYLERKYPSFGNLCPRDIASRAAKECCDEGRGVATTGLGVFLDFEDAIERDGEDAIRARYGNLFQMYEKISGDNPYKQPMQIYPAVHYTMGGLWVDYNLMSNLPGLHVFGEANFSDHGANRLGASALMQGLADGYFVIPSTIAVYLAEQKPGAVTTSHPEFKKVENEVNDRLKSLMDIKGTRSVDSFHRELGLLVWDKCGMARDRAGLEEALERIPEIRHEFWTNVRIPGSASGLNSELEKAGRVADFIEFAEVLCHDALATAKSPAAATSALSTNSPRLMRKFRTEPLRQGKPSATTINYQYVAAWEHTEPGQPPNLHKEELVFEEVKPSIRSYK